MRSGLAFALGLPLLSNKVRFINALISSMLSNSLRRGLQLQLQLQMPADALLYYGTVPCLSRLQQLRYEILCVQKLPCSAGVRVCPAGNELLREVR